MSSYEEDLLSSVKLEPESDLIKVAIVGDVHDLWDNEDQLCLKQLGIDLVLLVGDFGNESIPVVQSIAAMPLPKAVILGNHDAWYSVTEWGREKCPYDRQQEDWVQRQLDLLGETHVGYAKLDFPALNLSVIGGRPFSWGGSEWKHGDFYQSRYGVNSFEESTDRIVAAAEQASHDTLIFIGHCGPKGLGEAAEAPCGRDWKPIGGDYGDPDLAAAIAQVRQIGKRIPLVAFGHMHHQLRHTKERLRTMATDDMEGTVYLNAASVPRIKATETGYIRNFSLVTLKAGIVQQASLIWMNEQLAIVSESVLYRSPLLAE
ncbi:TIGR04168 family protein [Thermocoleostomius sinensis]|uniref:TIGR04168 family protein n=1 Tax=Thermocoleostomius sinensis A174 TaxID=2016057 RepID=A0A9E9C9A4_9CYAN|nr:TIGR04168 family protein [Thermocoleostomius sinensis]WAL62404.1 TIGR04168 family protein [Thermocoleostomius sinensis A174]